MSEERKKILEMLSSGKISVEEAERLLSAIENNAESTSGDKTETGRKRKYKYLRVSVEPMDGDPDGERVNVRVPLNLVRAGLKWATFIPRNARMKVGTAFRNKGIDMDFNQMSADDLEDIITNLDDLEVEVDGDEKVRVYCE